MRSTARRVALANEKVTNVVELANRTFTVVGDVLVDPATGRPVTFEDADLDDNNVLDTSDFQLAGGANSVRWYRFTTVGDGQAGNVLRLLPGAYNDRTTLVDGPAGYQNANGTVTDTGNLVIGGIGNMAGAFDFDLSSVLDALEDPNTLDSIKLRLFGSVAAQTITGTDEIVAGPTQVFFTGLTPETGRELFVTNGTAAGTALVKDIVPGLYGSFVSGLAMVGDRVFFIASRDGLPQLWTSDGTTAGTVRADIFTNGTLGSFADIHDLKVFNGKLFFVGVRGDAALGHLETLYAASDTDGGVYRIAALSVEMGTGETIAWLTPASTLQLYFAVTTSGGAAEELWSTNGTANAAFIRSFTPTSGLPLLSSAATISDRIFFAANGGASGTEVWASRGSSATTSLLHDINGAGSSNPGGFASTGSRVYFVASGDTIYSTDGTTLSNHGDVFGGSVPGNAEKPIGTIAGGNYYALIDTTMNTQLHHAFFNASTPTNAQVKLFGSNSTFSSLTPFGTSEVAFIETDSVASTSKVWRSNGSDRGTVTIFDNDTTSISRLNAFGTSLVFAGQRAFAAQLDPTTATLGSGTANRPASGRAMRTT